MEASETKKKKKTNRSDSEYLSRNLVGTHGINCDRRIYLRIYLFRLMLLFHFLDLLHLLRIV